MSDAERLEQLERRMAQLEEQMRVLTGQRGSEAARQPSTPAQAAPRPRGPTAQPATAPPPRRPAAPLLSSEQWIGQRVLLAVGVVALILAAGYLLRLSFDRGWISPVMRCIGGAGAGLIVGALGWRLHPRYRTYGAALIGCGAAIIYLSVWAAARLYGVVPPTTGILSLALVSVSLAMIAYAIDVEALGATAAVGAFFAPLLLGRNNADADLLLLYLACMAAGLGFVAARRSWRLTMFVVALSFFGVAYAGAADRGSPWGVLLYGVLGGSAGIHVGLREHWWETRFLSFSGGWTFVAAASRQLDHPWAIFAAGLVLALPVWWFALRNERMLAFPLGPGARAPGWSLGEALYFLLTPLLLGWTIHQLDRHWFDTHRGAAALLVGLPYLVAGYQRVRPAFALVAAAALGTAAWNHWSGVPRVWALLALVLLWAAVDHPTRRTDGRWYSLATLWAVLQQLFGEALLRRTADDAAFFGPWAVALWATALVSMLLAAGLWRRAGLAGGSPVPQGGLWALGGALILFGVTAEIRRYFNLKTLSAYTASLASSLAVSAWWLVFAAALVGLGFRRGLKPARVAGLGVAGLAVIKVLVFDLSSLDALYRVGSVFILGLVFLLLAYLYHRQGRTATQPKETPS
ncbi:MAG TPA: DUF2339 domain-containing protein [Gemmatimonadales bacterium]|nr:DUF2339 domain-containing protein [Gemmatimonadales bacterium]